MPSLFPSTYILCRLVYIPTSRHSTAFVNHNNGAVVVAASTTELAIARHLYKTSDVAAAYNVGRVMAVRCKEMGLYRVMWEHKADRNHKKVSCSQFIQSLVTHTLQVLSVCTLCVVIVLCVLCLVSSWVFYTDSFYECVLNLLLISTKLRLGLQSRHRNSNSTLRPPAWQSGYAFCLVNG